eukprot:13057461-Alexandrium_andersonii.AAC.1
MSASLVGSEMCIRDRFFACVISRKKSRCVMRRPKKQWAAAQPRAWPPSPVSYTHLTLPTICSV